MTRPRLLDLFACEGGATAGYQAAGFDVTAVDRDARALSRNPAQHTVVADALDYLDAHGHEFDAIHASPPCQDHSPLRHLAGSHGSGHLLADTLAVLARADRPWVVENVGGADLPGALVLCGTEFGLQTVTRDGRLRVLRRHRRFVSNVWLWGAGGCGCTGRRVAGVYGHGGSGHRPESRQGYQADKAEGSRLLRVDWMTQHGQAQCIPPAYAAFIGAQLHMAIRQTRSAPAA